MSLNFSFPVPGARPLRYRRDAAYSPAYSPAYSKVIPVMWNPNSRLSAPTPASLGLMAFWAQMFTSMSVPFSIFTGEVNWVLGSARVAVPVRADLDRELVLVNKIGLLEPNRDSPQIAGRPKLGRKASADPKIGHHASSRSDLHRPALARQHKVALELRQPSDRVLEFLLPVTRSFTIVARNW